VVFAPIGLKCLYNGAQKQPRRLQVLGEDEWLGNTRLGARNLGPLRAEKLSRRMIPLIDIYPISSKPFLSASPYVINLRYSTNLSLQNLKGHFSKIEDKKIFHQADMIFALILLPRGKVQNRA
jgi:hypothetical protein